MTNEESLVLLKKLYDDMSSLTDDELFQTFMEKSVSFKEEIKRIELSLTTSKINNIKEFILNLDEKKVMDDDIIDKSFESVFYMLNKIFDRKEELEDLEWQIIAA